MENFNFIGQAEVQEVFTEPNANFTDYMKQNFKKADKYLKQEFIDAQKQKPENPKDLQTPSNSEPQKPKTTIKNMLLMGITEEDDLTDMYEPSKDEPHSTPPYNHPTEVQPEYENAYNTKNTNENYYNSEDSNKIPFIRDSNIPNQNILLSENPYQSQNFHEPGLMNRLMSNYPTQDSQKGFEHQHNLSSNQSNEKRFVNDFEPNVFYNSENVDEEELGTIVENTQQNDFIERYSQEKQQRRSPEPVESPLERKTKYSDLIAKKDHFMKKYNIKIGSKKSKTKKVVNQKKNEINEPIKSKKKSQKNIKPVKQEKPKVAKKINNQFQIKTKNKINPQQNLNLHEIPSISSNQSINTLLHIDQQLKKSIEHKFNNSGEMNSHHTSFEERLTTGKKRDVVESHGVPNVRQASYTSSKSPYHQQTSLKNPERGINSERYGLYRINCQGLFGKAIGCDKEHSIHWRKMEPRESQN
jgi:hypothetical protein